jgi:hypothetical protein
VWVIIGTRAKSSRVPDGAKVERHCPNCAETTMFYEKEMTDTFRLYFIDIFDISRQRVMACGACGAHYATDEVATANRPREERLIDRVDRGLMSAGARLGSFVEGAAQSLESGLDELVRGKRPAPPAHTHEESEHELDDPLVDPVEARFRELERKAGHRK